MLMNNKHLDIEFLEKKIISKKNRFKLNNQEKKEISKLFENKNILVIGASGSIGSKFSLELINYKFKRLYLLDKNENELTGLNRTIIKKVGNKKIEYICSDINTINISSFLSKNKINVYLNFAAIKHVRSQENINSIKYMFSTNYENFFKMNYRSNCLKKIFCISTDKAAEPSSLMGVSKLMMEQKLKGIHKKYKNISVSSARFANVSFSKGSILEHALESISKKDFFGIPNNIKRYFITHEEAISICFQALLKKNDNSILIPNKEILGKQIYIQDIVSQVLKINNLTFAFVKNLKKKINKSRYNILISDNKISGQKSKEILFSNYEKKYLKKNNLTTSKLMLKNLLNINISKYKKMEKFNNINEIHNFISKIVKGYSYKKNQVKVSKIV